jgi:hypothetical protein
MLVGCCYLLGWSRLRSWSSHVGPGSDSVRRAQESKGSRAGSRNRNCRSRDDVESRASSAISAFTECAVHEPPGGRVVVAPYFSRPRDDHDDQAIWVHDVPRYRPFSVETAGIGMSNQPFRFTNSLVRTRIPFIVVGCDHITVRRHEAAGRAAQSAVASTSTEYSCTSTLTVTTPEDCGTRTAHAAGPSPILAILAWRTISSTLN